MLDQFGRSVCPRSNALFGRANAHELRTNTFSPLAILAKIHARITSRNGNRLAS